MKLHACLTMLGGTVAVASTSCWASASEGIIAAGTQRIYDNDAYPIILRKGVNANESVARYPGFNQTTTVLKAGTIRREGAKVLPCDILYERDVAVTLRDGTVIYTDIFRPTDTSKTYPALIAWSPYGKEIGSQWLDDTKNRSTVPLSAVSELQKFEAPDPAYWVNHGYVVLNPDARGADVSGGNMTFWGRQLAEDGYDFVEWAAKQTWSSSKVAFSGNSWLAVSQYFIAAGRPPHLTAIAPWEGLTDVYRDSSTRGGFPDLGFTEAITTTLPSNNFVEDVPRMALKDTLITKYWEDKIARLEQINVPAYVVASYLNPIHTRGSFDAFRKISSKQKWLRVHNTYEWPDYYNSEHVEDLRGFFDHFLKGVDNGWEKTTPRVRVAVLNPGGTDELNIPAADWPLPTVREKTLYLNNGANLGESKPSTSANFTYSATGTDGIKLMYTVPQDMSIIGYIKVRLWVEAVGSNDMDISLTLQKVQPNGEPYPSTIGVEALTTISATQPLRVSMRYTDPERSTKFEPFQTFDRVELLKPGEIVPVDVALWPTGMKFSAGERLQVVIKPATASPSTQDLGFGLTEISIPASGGTFLPGTNVPMRKMGGGPRPAYAEAQRTTTPTSPNNGSHVIHFGGKYDSYVLLPVNGTSIVAAAN